MPKGFKAIKVLSKSERDCHFEYGKRIRKGLNLMKEMAEALDSATKFIAWENGVISQEDVEEYKTLKKFKEWK